ncbi:MAG: hypothetical protein QY309_04830 [Cyclobacteriaceae bacterium]|nr:MAG: hypothetical protein QY309_04830 [Cyclobacteriaceae bacterium]
MISTAILSKIGLPLLIAGGSFFGGMVFQAKVLKPNIVVDSKPVVNIPRCPDCNCPPAIGTELDKIKNTRGTVNLHLHQNYTVAGDSTALRTIVEETINNAFDKRKIKKQ